MSDILTNTPWSVRNCGNPHHGPNWECHRVEDSTGRVLMKSVTREVAERYASVPALLEQALRAEARGFERARERAADVANDWEIGRRRGDARDLPTAIRAMKDETT